MQESLLAAQLVALLQVSIGRLSDNSITLGDNEVSGHHVAICWEAACRCWQVCESQAHHFKSTAWVTYDDASMSSKPLNRNCLWEIL